MKTIYTPPVISMRVFCFALLAVMFSGLGTALDAYAQFETSIYPDTYQVVAGNNVRYQIQLFNDSGITRTNAQAAITLPDNSRYVAATVDCNAAAAPVIVCPLGSFTGGESKTFDFVVKVLDDFVATTTTNGAGFFTFPVQASSDSGSNDYPESAPIVYVTELADLKVSLFSTDLTPRAGETFTLALTVDNFGPSAARNVEVYTRLGHGGLGGEGRFVTVQSCAFSVSQGCGAITQFTCATGTFELAQFGVDVGTFATNFLRAVTAEDPDCGDPEAPAIIPAGRLRGTFRMTTSQDLDLSGLVLAESDTPDPDNSDNESTIIYDVTGVADLSLTKSATGEMLVPGQEGLPYDILSGAPFPEAPEFTTSPLIVTQGRRIRYELEVENSGPSRAENVVITDRLPAGVTVVPGSLSVTDSGGNPIDGSCQFGTPGDVNDSMTCGLGSMQAPVQTGTPTPLPDEQPYKKVTFDVTVDHELARNTVLTNNAFISSDQFEDNNSDNLVSAFSVVSPLVGISGCSVGGSYTSVVCGDGLASIALNGFGFALPEAGPLAYAWSTDCLGGVFSDSSIANPSLSFITANPDNSPVSCQVQLAVSNIYADSVCSGAVTVVDCAVDCSGQLGGDAQFDRCGVCEGDGNSCLNCSSYDLKGDLLNALRANNRIRVLTVKNARQLADAARNAADIGGSRKAIRAARRLFQTSQSALLGIPSQLVSCTNTRFCVSASNSGTLSDISSSSQSALDLLRRTVKRRREATGDPKTGRKALRRGGALFGSSQLSLAKVPLTTSSCT